MAFHHHPFIHLFEKVCQIDNDSEREEILAELLHHGSTVSLPLCEFLSGQKPHARLAPLVELLGKLMDKSTVGMLLPFLEVKEAALRRAAAMALGWNRSKAALDKLDRLEGTDECEEVRRECRAAIEEILAEYPNLRTTLHHHYRMEDLTEQIAPHDQTTLQSTTFSNKSPKDFVPFLPRLVAAHHKVLPLEKGRGNRLYVAVQQGKTRQMTGKLATLIDQDVVITTLPREQLDKQIASLYDGGDDDFLPFLSDLNEGTINELRHLIGVGIHPGEPPAPLGEVADGVEALQAFLASCIAMKATRMCLLFRCEGEKVSKVSLLGEKGDSAPVFIDPPDPALVDRFFETAMFFFNIRPGQSPEGEINVVHPVGKQWRFKGEYQEEPSRKVLEVTIK